MGKSVKERDLPAVFFCVCSLDTVPSGVKREAREGIGVYSCYNVIPCFVNISEQQCNF